MLTDIASLTEAGALAITDDGSPVADEVIMRDVLKQTAKYQKLFVQHCEVISISNGGVINEGEISKKLGVKGIPNASEYKIIERDIELTREIDNARYHVQHISTKEAVNLVMNANQEGLRVSAEACPHHFILSDDAVFEIRDKCKDESAVVLGSLYDLPPVWEDGCDALFRNPGLLAKAGVKIAFSSSSASVAKDLPYHAAKAAAFGLDRAEALRAVTINPAEIFGVADRMGSLEKGKAANIVLADNDILEMRASIVKVWIDGRECDMSNRYTELLEKFKKR